MAMKKAVSPFPPTARFQAGRAPVAFQLLWGPITIENRGPDQDRIAADGVFLAWTDRRVYAVRWRVPLDGSDPAETVCVPAPGDAGLNELWLWLMDLKLLDGQQVLDALKSVGALLHAMSPTSEHASDLLEHPNELVRAETLRTLRARPAGAPVVRLRKRKR
ncbi:MAG: hypothetical protein ACYC3F_01105 [Gemmatimonadaceae bacterium]